MKTLLFAAPLLALALCGCSLIQMEPYRQTVYFDVIPTKEEIRPDAAVSSIFVSSGLQFSDRMLFKIGSEKLEFDEYHRWLAAPEVLVKRFLETALTSSSSAKCSLKIQVLRFELDKPEKSATCALLVSVMADGKTLKTFSCEGEAKTKGSDAADYAKAMHEALAKAAGQIADELKKANG